MSLKEKENHISESLSENLVTDYLKNNPNFFVENPLILTELKIPHESGTAISLVEKQLAVLRDQNQETNQRLSLIHI